MFCSIGNKSLSYLYMSDTFIIVNYLKDKTLRLFITEGI